jgi:hypothetical protein
MKLYLCATVKAQLIMDNVDFDFAMCHPIGHTVAIVAEVRPTGLFCLEWGETQPGQVRHP